MPAYLMYGSAVFTVAGVASHLLWFKPARDRLAAEPTLDAYRADTGAFDTSRAVTIGLYAAAAITLATGLVLHDHRSAAHVAVVPRSGGGSLVVEWAR